MNNKSITYVNKINQILSAEDQFFCGAESISAGFLHSQGVTGMNPQRELELYIEELIANYAKYEDEVYSLDLDQIPDYEQAELTRLFLESIDREMECEAIHGNDFGINSDFNCALLAMLKNDNSFTRSNFAEITHRNITTYYADSFNKILSDACNDYLHNLNGDEGYYARIDREHGDLEWRKIS